MKFVCRNCESYMKFDEVEGVRDDSLGVTFGCAKCGARISMVTNAGETHMVRSLGVKLGGAPAPEPMELTRTTLADSGGGKCPFAGKADAALAKSAPSARSTPQAEEKEPEEVEWSAEAWKRLQNVPSFVRPAAKSMIESMAREGGTLRVDDALMDRAKEKFM